MPRILAPVNLAQIASRSNETRDDVCAKSKFVDFCNVLLRSRAQKRVWVERCAKKKKYTANLDSNCLWRPKRVWVERCRKWKIRWVWVEHVCKLRRILTVAAVKGVTTYRHALYSSHSQSGSSDCVFHEKYAFWLIGMRISRMGGVTTPAHAYFSRNTQSELQKAPFSRNTRFGCRQPPPVTNAKKR